ncbi:MAG: hypothetical protein HYT68_00350 [Candidatus Zambryskibacteria bacterium]|nr:hypothetical protein [Candidatus Zambryskibacteria bacterium]
MKNLFKRILPTRLFIFVRDIFYPEKINILENRLSNLFITHYQSIAASELYQKIAFKNAEFKVYSKHGGDGILAYIFSKLGTTNCTFVEIGVEDGRECNTANLSRNFGWQGLMIDGNQEWIKSAQDFYKDYKVKVVACFVTAENINRLIIDNGYKDEVDLLSIDIDSNDYWVWRSVTVINPRVVVVEYNAAFGLRSMTIKYDPHFHYQETYRKNPLYFGTSLAALSKLAKEKGYLLIGCDSHGHDAFFVRKDVAKEKFVELSPEEAFYPNPYSLKKFGSIEEQFEQIKHLDFEEI